MEQNLIHILEAALFAAGSPLTFKRLQELFDPESETVPTNEQMTEALTGLKDKYQEHTSLEFCELANGYCFRVRAGYGAWVTRLWEEKPQRYSRALLETLAIIAYRQPVTRGEIEEIRGVVVSSHIVKTLLEREWIRLVGHRDVPGRPGLYGTTKSFLDHFGLTSLDELPTLSQIRDLDSIELPAEILEAEAMMEAAKQAANQIVQLESEPELTELPEMDTSESEPRASASVTDLLESPDDELTELQEMDTSESEPRTSASVTDLVEPQEFEVEQPQES
jgi:segregation and condensation protein B